MPATKPIESYVPPEILELFQTLQEQHGWTDVRDFNKYIRDNKPNVPKSTRKRWSRAFIDGRAHTETPTWHVRYRDTSSIVPEKYSALRGGQFREAQETWRREKWIKYANVGDLHRPLGDGALLSLALEIIQDFEPNAIPYFSDWLDMDRFKPHATKPGDAVETIIDETAYAPRRNKYDEFEQLCEETITAFDSVLPEGCVKLNLFGNHEIWILRHLMGLQNTRSEQSDPDLVERVINQFFDMFQSHNILWVEADRHRYVPLCEHLWVGHGHKAKGGEGATARAYMNQVRGDVSIAVGHSHRQEIIWSKTPREEHFYAVAGTLGRIRPAYAQHEFLGHNWGFQLITQPFNGWKGATVEDIRIFYKDGFYVTNWRGKEYSQQATLEYDGLLTLE